MDQYIEITSKYIKEQKYNEAIEYLYSHIEILEKDVIKKNKIIIKIVKKILFEKKNIIVRWK